MSDAEQILDDAKGCWVPGEKSREARRIARSAGLRYVDDIYIADAVRQWGIST